nr:hypothetical protein [Tanacetum cinerariifolium]
MEDLQLGVENYQKKLNLTKPNTYMSDLKRKEAYIGYFNPQGFIYQNKDKKNRLMRIDELHKFGDGTLIDVRTALDDRLKGIQMQYLPQSIWRKIDKDRAAAMIQAIDNRLKTRRSMRSLESDFDLVPLTCVIFEFFIEIIIHSTSLNNHCCGTTPSCEGFAAVLAVLKLERLKADGARRLLISVLLFIVCEEASKIELCPSEIILDDLLALDLIVRFDLSDRRLE